jgi:hypothetical protein
MSFYTTVARVRDEIKQAKQDAITALGDTISDDEFDLINQVEKQANQSLNEFITLMRPRRTN